MKSSIRIIKRFSVGLGLSILLLPFVSSEPLTHEKEGYSIPFLGYDFVFPRDHGSHPDFRTEWWYITGHLESESPKRSFGFQITFFRSATLPENEESQDSMPRQIFMAHAAILDKDTGIYTHEERFNREGWNAYTDTQTLDIANGNWRLQLLDTKSEEMEVSFSIKANNRQTLTLAPLKPKVFFGDKGVSRKGENPTAKSYYITFPRLRVSGTLIDSQEELEVTGVAWMDHEISSSQLSQGQIGWNWTSLIMDDGTEMMAYVMRREDGQVDPFSTLYLIDATGKLTRIDSDAFSWNPKTYWKSDDTGANYPVGYEIRWTHPNGEKRSLSVRTPHPNQEIIGSIGDFCYWEGAGTAYDESGKAIGKAYTELTGYNESLYGKF